LLIERENLLAEKEKLKLHLRMSWTRDEMEKADVFVVMLGPALRSMGTLVLKPGNCQKCNSDEKLERDHVLEVQLFAHACVGMLEEFSIGDVLRLGELLNSYENTAVLCKSCNISKGAYWKHKLSGSKNAWKGYYSPSHDELVGVQSVFKDLLLKGGKVDSIEYAAKNQAGLGTNGVTQLLFQVHNLWNIHFPEYPL
jgi:5-methylcytosine-specific restriction endonuclease McrA